MCGDDGKKVTPVPMPNTVVKLLSAEGSEGFPLVRLGRCRAIESIIFGWCFFCTYLSYSDVTFLYLTFYTLSILV